MSSELDISINSDLSGCSKDVSYLTLYSSGLEIRVVLCPQSTKTSVGPPDISTWWSGGLLKTLIIKKQYFYNIY